MSRGSITPTDDGILINLRVSPGAKHTSIEGPYGEKSISFLAEILGTSPSDIKVVRGASSKDKVVLVRGRAHFETRKLLSTRLH